MKLPSILDLTDKHIEQLRKIYYIHKSALYLDSHARRVYRQKACQTENPAETYREILIERLDHARRIYLFRSGIDNNDLASLSNMGILVPDTLGFVAYYTLSRNGLKICDNLFNSENDYLKKLSSIRQSLDQANQHRYHMHKHEKHAFKEMIHTIWQKNPIYGFANEEEVIRVYETKENYLQSKLIQSLLNEQVPYNLIVIYLPGSIIVYIDHSPTKVHDHKNPYASVSIHKGRWEMLTTLEDIFANQNNEQAEKIYRISIALLDVMQVLDLK